MKIDIIDLTNPDYQGFTPEQLSFVRQAQLKKNKIVAAAEKEKHKLFFTMLKNGVVRSRACELKEQAIDKQVEEDIEFVYQNLLYLLAYRGMEGGNEYGPYRYPENPDYTLSPSQRFLVVHAYYMGVTRDPEARFLAFKMDKIAKPYLGEFYNTLHDLLASYVEDD